MNYTLYFNYFTISHKVWFSIFVYLNFSINKRNYTINKHILSFNNLLVIIKTLQLFIAAHIVLWKFSRYSFEWIHPNFNFAM